MEANRIPRPIHNQFALVRCKHFRMQMKFHRLRFKRQKKEKIEWLESQKALGTGNYPTLKLSLFVRSSLSDSRPAPRTLIMSDESNSMRSPIHSPLFRFICVIPVLSRCYDDTRFCLDFSFALGEREQARERCHDELVERLLRGYPSPTTKQQPRDRRKVIQ